MKNKFHYIFMYCAFLSVILLPNNIYAQQLTASERAVDGINESQRRALARSFVSKLKARFSQFESQFPDNHSEVKSNILDEGEILMLQPVLGKNFRIDGVVLAFVRNGEILLSLRDAAEVLKLPIRVDIESKMAKGWYIREEKSFLLDLNNNIMRSDVGEFNVSDNVIIRDNDIWVPVHEFAKWIDFDINPIISSQDLNIVSSDLLPIQEYYNRRKFSFVNRNIGKPALPRGDDGYKAISFPSIDVATSSSYKKSGEGKEGIADHRVDIKTTGGFAYGTLSTQSRINNRDQISSVRVNYKQESDKASLLGSLKARRFEVGDITMARVPFGGKTSQELGVRVSSTDSVRAFTTPTTGISGSALPDWDVELYREGILVAFKEVGEDGFYSFDNVDLYMMDNNFKLIFYGPQGEVREEELFIPVDQLLSSEAGVYDVSLSLNKENTYNKKRGAFEDPDKGSLNISAYYEKPVMGGVTLSAGGWSSQNDGKRNFAGNVGFSAVVAQALVNGGLGVDDDGDMSGELSLRKNIGLHEFRDSLKWQGAGFDSQSGGEPTQNIGNIQNNFSVYGPLPLPWGGSQSHKYSIGVDYSLNTDDEYSVATSVGISSSIKNISINKQLQHKTGSKMPEDSISSLTNLSGSIGKNRLRLGIDYAFKPDSELRSVLATYRRDLTKKVNLELGVTKRPLQDLTEYSAKLDWQAGFIRISPSVRYNSEQDFFAGLNTRFGVLREPVRNRSKFYDSNISNFGAVSAFVFLDKDGDGEFNGDDEPLENVVVKAPQNGGRRKTDENGIALFDRMTNLKLTDIFLDKESLQDPVWVGSFEGVSILPREGYVAEVVFPVHISGEIDGSVYARAVKPFDNETAANPVPLRNIRLSLYNDTGALQDSVMTDAGGFYYFPQVPPGRYLLVINEKSAVNGGFIRPEPQQIEIDYDGTVIYGNDLYVNMGDGDIPSAFLTNLDDYKSRHPHIDFSDKNYDLVLNLGEFNSRLLMSVVWYKIRTRYGDILTGGKLFVPPEQSYASIKTGKHILRIGLDDKTLGGAYARCRSLMARNQYCKVEIYSSYIKQARAD